MSTSRPITGRVDSNGVMYTFDSTLLCQHLMCGHDNLAGVCGGCDNPKYKPVYDILMYIALYYNFKTL